MNEHELQELKEKVEEQRYRLELVARTGRFPAERVDHERQRLADLEAQLANESVIEI